MFEPTAIRKYARYQKDSQFEVTSYSAFWKWKRKKVLSCSWCPPNRSENRNSRGRWATRGWKDRTKNKKQYQDKTKNRKKDLDRSSF